MHVYGLLKFGFWKFQHGGLQAMVVLANQDVDATCDSSVRKKKKNKSGKSNWVNLNKKKRS